MELAVGEIVSTHSRPKAAGDSKKIYWASTVVSTHSRPKAAGSKMPEWSEDTILFQHTAARRRLEQRMMW